MFWYWWKLPNLKFQYIMVICVKAKINQPIFFETRGSWLKNYTKLSRLAFESSNLIAASLRNMQTKLVFELNLLIYMKMLISLRQEPF